MPRSPHSSTTGQAPRCAIERFAVSATVSVAASDRRIGTKRIADHEQRFARARSGGKVDAVLVLEGFVNRLLL